MTGKRRRIRTVTAASFPCFRLEWRLAAKASNTWKGVLLAEIRREMERLRPVYETGVLRLLLRNNSMLYVALLRSTFDPLTGELPREIVEERFARQSQPAHRNRRLHAERRADCARGRAFGPA